MKINWDNFVESYLILSRTVALIFRIDIVRYLSVHSAGLFVAVWCNIYNFIRHISMQPQKHLTNIKKNKPTNRSTFHTFADISLHQTDIYMNSLQRPFRFFAEYFCIKLCQGDWKCETWKYGTVKNAGPENARHEFAAPTLQGWKMRDMKMRDQIAGVENAGKVSMESQSVKKCLIVVVFVCRVNPSV